MSLTTRPKPKAHARKRQAQHHRRSKHYMKAYFPYMPIVGILALGVLADRSWASTDTLGTNPQLATTRLGLVTGNQSSGLFYAVMALTFIAFAIFIVTHWYRFHRFLNRGEKFIVDHPWVDLGLVVIVTAGVVLTRA